ncbi:MAG: hypothetical protein HY286_14950 [Planctomycetes bacterium]|nr:hypothetical protein [Planctomycetota bacterium]
MLEIPKVPARYVFFGVIHPERAVASVAPEVFFEVNNPNDGVKGALRLRIILSRISAQFFPIETVTNIYTLKNEVEANIRSVVDLIGFVEGCGYDVEIIQVLDLANGEATVFGVDIPAIRKLMNDNKIIAGKAFQLYNKSGGQYLRRCLADLRESIRNPLDTGTFCFRAMECIRQYFVDTFDLDTKASWLKMRESLGIDRDELDFINEQFAKPRRHGEAPDISDQDRARILTIAWTTTMQFIEYLNNDEKRV